MGNVTTASYNTIQNFERFSQRSPFSRYPIPLSDGMGHNKFKDTDRSSLSQETLSNYLYINTNMGTLEKFDSTPAACCWLAKKKRHPKTNNRAHQQEWFHGVFHQPPNIEKKNKQIYSKIQF